MCTKMLKYEMTLTGISCKFLRSLILFKKNNFVRYLNTSQIKLTEDDVEEVRIPVPWGHIAGKWWGNKLLPPIIAIHGWQDNANSFDKLIPLLNTSSVIAIDLPGHGFSSHLPDGKAYDFKEHIFTLHRIKKYFNVSQIPLMTHSYGGALGYAYSSIFPNEVKWLVNIDCARSLMTLIKRNFHKTVSQGIDAILKIEKQKKENLPPAYTLREMIKMSLEGSLGSLASLEAALILLKRGIYEVNLPPKENTDKVLEKTDLEDFLASERQAVMTLPDDEKEKVFKIVSKLTESMKNAINDLKNYNLGEAESKFYSYKRDPTIKVLVFQSFSESFVIEASKHIKCPVLSLRAKDGFLFASTKKLYEDTLDILKTSSKYLEHHDVEGTHHTHLNTPEAVAPIINSFIEKCDSLEGKF